MNVAFLNENALGHASYLPRFAAEFRKHPELGIDPKVLDVVPMPEAIQRQADFTVRGLRRWGLDFHVARWRRVASRQARRQLDELRRRERVEAVVVNTQSVALSLVDPPLGLPFFVALDATFRQLSRSRWFAANRLAAGLLPLTLAPILGAERRLFAAADRLLPWSAPVRDSLLKEYGANPDRVSVLPPSLDLDRLQAWPRPANPRPQILFLGGDFQRKGGPILMEAFRRELASRADLHVITQSDVATEPGVIVHQGVTAQSDAWFERWRQADVFVFPSSLETFGIVLLEALAFGVPVVASRVGAAEQILEQGRAGILVDEVCPKTLSRAVRSVLEDPASARQRCEAGLVSVRRDYDLHRNAAALATWLKASATR
jgi:glycosyltransferase involved in cell wall biosynthesis